MRFSLFFTVAFVLCCFITPGCRKTAETTPQAPVLEVKVATVATRDVQIYREYTGYAQASEALTIQARVKGNLEDILFAPGSIVQGPTETSPGDKLFVIEQTEYKANLLVARANVEKAKAQLEFTKALVERGSILVKDSSMAPEEYETRKVQYQQAIADLETSEANLVNAERIYSYTEIYAPVTGKVSRNLVDKGNLVGGTFDTVLTTIMKMDPIHIYFQISDTDFSNVGRELAKKSRSETKNADNTKLPFSMGFLQTNDSVTELNESFPYQGFVNFADNTIEQNTGMITLRGDIDNPNYEIYPGQICRIKIPTQIVTGANLVHERAVSVDLGSHFMWIVNKDSKVERRNVELGELVERNMYIITKGIEAGETYIVDGLQKVRVNEVVSPIPLEKN